MQNNILTNRINLWDKLHDKNDKFSLTGAVYDSQIFFLQLNELMKPGLRVLEVGIGFGYITKHLYDMGIKISALDISPKSLDRVKDFCENVYTVEDIDKLPDNYFDIIFSCNVIQHIPDSILIDELKQLMRSLNENGTFGFQFVSTKGNKNVEGGIGCYFRKPDYLKKILTEMGGICELKVDINDLKSGPVNGSHVLHVTKNKKINNVQR